MASLYISLTIDELFDEVKKLDKKTFQGIYGGNIIRILKRPKNWKTLLIAEYRPDKIYYLSQKYNIQPHRIKIIINDYKRRKKKESLTNPPLN